MKENNEYKIILKSNNGVVNKSTIEDNQERSKLESINTFFKQNTTNSTNNNNNPKIKQVTKN